MLYVVGEIIAWLGLATLLGIGIGWLVFVWRRPARSVQPVAPAATDDPEEVAALREEAARFAAMTAELEEVVGEHNETLTILRSEADAAGSLVEERERELRIAEQQVSELRELVEAPGTGRDTEATGLRARLDEREAEVRELRARLDERDGGATDELQERLGQQQAEADALRAELERRRAEAGDAEEELRRRTAELEGVRVELVRVQSDAAQAPGSTSDDIEMEVRELREAAREADSRVVDLRDSVQQRDRELAGMREQLATSASRLGEYEAASSSGASDDRMRELTEALEEREARLRALEGAVADRDDALSKWQAASNEQIERSAALEHQLAELWAELERATAPDGEAAPVAIVDTAEIDRLRAALAERDTELDDLRARLGAAEAARSTNGSEARAVADDLREINGVGPKMAKTLQELGVDSFRELALLTDSRIAQLVQRAPSIGTRIERDGWVEQARMLYEDKYGVPVDVD